MKPLQISPETAQTLSARLKIPLEHLMHMPQHFLMQKLMELAQEEEAKPKSSEKDGTLTGESAKESGSS